MSRQTLVGRGRHIGARVGARVGALGRGWGAAELRESDGSMVRRFAFGLVLAAVAAIGFVAVLVILERPGPVRSGGPISIQYRMRAGDVPSGTLTSGWQRPGQDVVWMAGPRAELTLLPQGVATSTTRLVLVGVARAAARTGTTRVRVIVNGQDVGAVSVGSDGRAAQGTFELGQEIVNRTYPLQIELASDGPEGGFGVVALTLRETRAPTNFKGVVDGCSRKGVNGWALDGQLPAGITVIRGGQPYVTVIADRVRPDLARAGLPTEAGFGVALEPPASPGDVIRVTFEDGRDLVLSPCTVK